MPTFSEIGAQLNAPDDIHKLRLQYLQAHAKKEKRAVISYYANHSMGSPFAMVNDDDMLGLMETLCGVKEKKLDLILHSLGGSPDAADTFVSYLREKFDHVRVFVPQYAMSAATMIACGADEVVMARHSFLGPIDLQINIDGDMVAAQDVLDQYELVKEDFDGKPKSFWLGPGVAYFPTLLVSCRNALLYGQEVAERYLGDVMFKGAQDAREKAASVAEDLADHRKHKHHGKRLSRQYLKDLGMKVADLEPDQDLQDIVLSIHHCCLHTFRQHPPMSKLIQNHDGRVFVGWDPRLLHEMGRSASAVPTSPAGS